MTWRIVQGDALERLREMPDESVHCCVTSPPYWGLRDYGVDGQLGLEETPEQFVADMVAVFAEVRRVLRSDGTLWLNIGDSYARSAGHRQGNFGRDKDLAGMPWRLALALQAAGWFLRSDTIEEVELYCPCGCEHVLEERVWRHSPDREIVWNKPNPMPESVTDRPTRSHEYVFLLTKAPRYYYDAEAIREPDKGSDHPRAILHRPEPSGGVMPEHSGIRTAAGRQGFGRNKRSVWTIATRPFPEAHFATFPPDLVEPCILAGTSSRVCGACGASWQRVTERTQYGRYHDHTDELTKGHRTKGGMNGRELAERYSPPRTVGWEPTCDHADDSGRAVVFDPFAGAATTGLVATQLGRDFIGIELNPEYVALGEQRIRRWEANPAGHLTGDPIPMDGQESLMDPLGEAA